MGALAGLSGGNGGTGGAGTEGGEGGSTLTSPHRSFGPLKKSSTSAIVSPTYALGLPFGDSPAIISKVFCAAAAKPRARICRPAVDRFNAKGGGLPRLHVGLEPAAPAPSRPSGSHQHARWLRHLWRSYRPHGLGSVARRRAIARTSERQGVPPGAASRPQRAAP